MMDERTIGTSEGRRYVGDVGEKRTPGWLEYLVLTGLLMAAVGGFAISSFAPADIVRPTWAEWSMWAVRDVGLIVAIVAAIAAGIRLLRAGRVSARAILMLVGGGIGCVALTFLTVFAEALAERAIHIADFPSDARLLELETSISKPELTPENRSSLSRTYAQLRYQKDGTIVEWIQPDGRRSTYQSTTADREIRAIVDRLHRLGSWGTVWIERAVLFWVGVGIAGVAIGLLFPIRSAHPHADSH